MATYKPIQSFTTTGNESVVTFLNIPQDYTDLVIVSNVVWTSDAYINNMRFNGDAGSNYSYTRITGNGTSAVSSRLGNINYAFGGWTGVNPTLNTVHIMNYSNSTKYKTSLVRTNLVTDRVVAYVNMWRNTNAITSITLAHESGSAYSAGSTFSLYGIKAGTAKAQGGDTITTDGTYFYHTFKTSGTFVVQQDSSLSVDYLVVAGGGGGGGSKGPNIGYGGGGGAGGYRTSIGGTALSLAPGTVFPVLVGAGGAGTSYSTSGGNSQFSTIISTGGGFGGNTTTVGRSAIGDGANGGSGGGAGNEAKLGGLGNTPATSPSQGNNGGAGYVGPNNAAGSGGGGASAAGSAGVNNGAGGAGGNGTANSISGSSVTYAGGGGGGVENATYAGGAGGTGGGGRGLGSTGAAVAGTANLGGGGGGGGTTDSKPGGSGIVIVRYPV